MSTGGVINKIMNLVYMVRRLIKVFFGLFYNSVSTTKHFLAIFYLIITVVFMVSLPVFANNNTTLLEYCMVTTGSHGFSFEETIV